MNMIQAEKSPSTPSLDPGQMGRPGQSTDPGPKGPTGTFEGGLEAATGCTSISGLFRRITEGFPVAANEHSSAATPRQAAKRMPQEARPVTANEHSNAAAPPQAAKRARPAEAAGREGPTVYQPVAGPSGLHGFRAPLAQLPLKKRDVNQQSQPVPLVRGLDVSEQLRLQKLSQLEKLRAQGIKVSVTPPRMAPPATQVKATNTGGTPRVRQPTPQQTSKRALTARAAYAETMAKKKAETAPKTQGRSKKRTQGQRKRSAAATDPSPILNTPETRPCEICFESVKKGSYNRHMKGHGR